MLLMDILLISAIAVFVLGWWSRQLPRRGIILLAAAVTAVVVGAMAVLDDRWQAGTGLIVGFLFLLVLLIIRLRSKEPKRNIPYISGTLFVILGVLVFLSIYLFPVNDLPAPSGKYKVGVQDFELVDESRKGLIAAGEDEPRRLLVRAWYPAGSTEGLSARPYFKKPEVDATAGALGNNLIQAPFFFKYLKHAHTNSHENAPLLAGAKQLPVVFYSHGYMSFNGQNTALMEELASHGYAVYSVMHGYDSADVVLPDGTVLKTDERLAEDRDQTLKAWKDGAVIKAFLGETFDDRYFGQIETHEKAVARNDRYTVRSTKIWLEDRLFVHDTLSSGTVPAAVADLVAASEFSNTGEMGMSFGGSTTGAVCMIDSRCAAGVNLDGGDFHFTPFGKNMPVPFMMFYSDYAVGAAALAKMVGIENSVKERHGINSFSYERHETAALRDDIFRFMAVDAMHLGFSDLPHFVRRPIRDSLFGATNADEMIWAQNDIVRGFFDKYLRGIDNNFPGKSLAARKDRVVVEDISDLRTWWLDKHPEDRTVRVVLETELGEIELALYPERAPVSVSNFLAYIESGLFDGATFYRAARRDAGDPFDIVQGGLLADTFVAETEQNLTEWNPPIPPIALESTLESGILNARGTIAYGRLDPGSASSEFFINLVDNPSLNAGENAHSGDGLGYATFGRILRGMRVLEEIQNSPADAATPIENVKGQILDDPVKIQRAYRIKEGKQ